MGPKSNMISVLIKRGELDPSTHTARAPCTDECRHQGYTAEAMEPHRLPASHQKLRGKSKIDSPSRASEGTNPVDILITDFCPLGLWDNKFLLSHPFLVLCYSSLSKWMLFPKKTIYCFKQKKVHMWGRENITNNTFMKESNLFIWH